MKSLEARFRAAVEKSPNHSSFICFGRAIQGQKFSRKVIVRWFNKLVDPDDYAKREKPALLKFLWALSNMAEEGEFKGKSPFLAPLISQDDRNLVATHF